MRAVDADRVRADDAPLTTAARGAPRARDPPSIDDFVWAAAARIATASANSTPHRDFPSRGRPSTLADASFNIPRAAGRGDDAERVPPRSCADTDSRTNLVQIRRASVLKASPGIRCRPSRSGSSAPRTPSSFAEYQVFRAVSDDPGSAMTAYTSSAPAFAPPHAEPPSPPLSTPFGRGIRPYLTDGGASIESLSCVSLTRKLCRPSHLSVSAAAFRRQIRCLRPVDAQAPRRSARGAPAPEGDSAPAGRGPTEYPPTRRVPATAIRMDVLIVPLPNAKRPRKGPYAGPN